MASTDSQYVMVVTTAQHREMLSQALDNPANPFLEGITLERLKAGGAVRLNVEQPHPAFADGRFPTLREYAGRPKATHGSYAPYERHGCW